VRMSFLFCNIILCYLIGLCEIIFFVIYFFFFQAEDGIRDLIVTGVQTCALPICSDCSEQQSELKARIEKFLNERKEKTKDLSTRSEERRVGKECRSRWSRYH